MEDSDDTATQKAADALKRDEETTREGSAQKIGDAERKIGGKLDEEV